MNRILVSVIIGTVLLLVSTLLASIIYWLASIGIVGYIILGVAYWILVVVVIYIAKL